MWEFGEAEKEEHVVEGVGEKLRARGFFSLSAAHTRAGQFICASSSRSLHFSSCAAH